MSSNSPIEGSMTPTEKVDFAIARTRDAAFDAVCELWRKRQAEGMTQAELAAAMEADEGWVSRNLKGPGNWTTRTLARFVAGLDGEVEIIIHDLLSETAETSNYDAYVARDVGRAPSSNSTFYRVPLE